MGEDIIVKGTINCDEKFDDDFLNTFEERASTIIKMFDKMIAMANHVRKTSYCSIGRKSIYVHSDKSVACDKFKQRKNQ